jgi:hypothetical protein
MKEPKRGPKVGLVVDRLRTARIAAGQSGLVDLMQLLDDAAITILGFQIALEQIAVSEDRGPATLAQQILGGYEMQSEPKPLPLLGSSEESVSCAGAQADPVSP